MYMYEISPATYKAAKQYNLDIFPSKKSHFKIDAYRGGVYVGSVGDIRYKDYHIYLKARRQAGRRRTQKVVSYSASQRHL